MKRILLVVAFLAVAAPIFALNISRDVPLQFRQWQNEWQEDEGKVANVSCSQGSEFGGIITGTITLTDSDSTALTAAALVKLVITSDNAGDTIVVSTNDNEAVTAVTGSFWLTGQDSVQDQFLVKTTATGTASATFWAETNTPTQDYFLWIVLPNGEWVECLDLEFE